MQVTAIEHQKYRRDVYSVYIDGKEAFTLHGRVLADSGLEKDSLISQSRIDELVQLDDFFSSLEYAELLLSYRKRSKKELFDKLTAKGYSPGICAKALNVLEENGSVDDREFALWWIKSRRGNRPKGDNAIYSELMRKGVSAELINESVSIINSEEPPDEVELAWKACSSMLESYRNLPPTAARRRLTALLKRRGFSWDVVRKIEDRFFSIF
ncbi:MAG: RecX family transcriptional regulator [Elusimicrobiota bacterium]